MFRTLISITLALMFNLVTLPSLSNDLVQHFENPKQHHKPWAFWYWINGNITEEGIYADLKSMSEAGLGGVVLMHINEHDMIPEGPVRFLSTEYKALLKYTFDTAEKYNLQVNLYNSEGWSVAGGPWIKPEMGMKELAWSEINTQSRYQKIQFPKPHAPLGFYKDIVTLAFPTPTNHIEPSFNELIKSVYVSGKSSQQNTKNEGQVVVDKDWNTLSTVTQDAKTGERFIKLSFHKPYTFKNAFIKFAAYGMMGRNNMLISNDDKTYTDVASAKRGQIYDDIGCFEFNQVTAKYVKFVFKPTDNKLLYTAMPKVTAAVREISLDNRDKTKDWCRKAAHSFPFFNPEAERVEFTKQTNQASTIPFETIIDVSQYLDHSGTLNWTPPSDNWTIVRFGMSSTEAINRPASEGGEGLEVDKMNTSALDVHFNGLLKVAKELAGDKIGSTFFSTHADSWEVGRQNWTDDFANAFKQKKGYSPLLYLPATLGYVIDSPNTTERFLWDMRKTIADLIAERFYGGMRERANAMGIKFSAQSMKPFIDNIYALGQADLISANNNFRALPTSNNMLSQRSAYFTAKMTASAGSIYGRFVTSESFTALPEANRWLNHPEYYKPQADIDLAAGVNQITHHLFTHQPWVSVKPGMTLNYWGVHYERTQTWWHETPSWNNYLSRVQSLLSQGQPVFDILHLLGDDSSTKADSHFIDSVLPKGYDFEFISTHGLLNQLSVNSNGDLTYPTGRTYQILNLADDVSMRPEVLNKLLQLLKQGAIIVGKPPTGSPSLQGKDRTNKRVNELAKKVWGGQFNNQVFTDIPSALQALNIQPDLTLENTDSKLVWRHHHVAEANQDIYFISNVGAKPTEFTAHFRVLDKQPELWNPYTGERQLIKEFKQTPTHTIIDLKANQVESYFVVFSEKPSTSDIFNSSPLKTAKTLNSPWNVEFIKGVDKPKSVKLNTLIDLKDHLEKNIKYFSGTALYTTSFEYNPSKKTDYFIDLGDVHQFARVFINGQNLGVKMWSPYRYNVSNLLLNGQNTLEIEVTNLWPNRLIGDEREYEDTANWKPNGYQGEQLVAFPDWLKGHNPQQPGERKTWATWKHWSKEDALIPSGLLGPVTIMAQKK